MSHTNKLILGTVQFGLPYGINNQEGRPTKEAVDNILRRAHEAGIRTLDTAEAYGDALETIGCHHEHASYLFGVINKLSRIGEPWELKQKISATISKLHIEAFDALLIHSFRDYADRPGVVDELFRVKQDGLLRRVGLSVYTNDEFEVAISDPRIDIIQLPYNLLDNMHHRGHLLKKAKEKNKLIHGRSVFLQGLFFMPVESLPRSLQPLIPKLRSLHDLSLQTGFPISVLALQYALSNPLIDGVLIGVDNIHQLETNITAASINIPREIMACIDEIYVEEEGLLNPTNWVL